MKEEIWKPVVGFEGYYEISSLGRVKRVARVSVDSLGRTFPYKERYLKVKVSRHTGYPCVNLSKNGEQTPYCIHRLIADAFIPNPNNLPCVNHIDEDRSNSVLSNLEWCDYSYNNSYGQAKEKRRITMRKNLEGKHKPIYQFTTSGNLVCKYDCGVNQTEEKLGYLIGDCLTGKSKTAHGYVFSYSPIFSYEEDKPKSHQKYVIKIDGNGNELARYKSVSVAAKENGFDRHKFSTTKPFEGVTHIKGMMFVVEKKENEFIPKGHKGPRPDLLNKGAIPVSQYSREGDYIRTFVGAADAARFLGKKSSGSCDITNCCRGNLKTAYGYIWRYADKKEQDKKGIAPKQLTLF